MSAENKDRKLEEYLAGSSPVSRSYQDMGNPEPSPELDRAVLSEARRVGRARTYSRSRVRWNTWFVAATVAATVALSISLVLEVTTFGPMFDDMTAIQQPAPAPAPDTVLRSSVGDDSEELAEEEALPARERKAALAKTETEYHALPAERMNMPEAQSSAKAVAPTERSSSVLREELAAVAGERPDEVAKGDGAQLAHFGAIAEGAPSIAGLEENRSDDMPGSPATAAPQPTVTSGRIQAAQSSDSLANRAPADADTVPGYPAPDVWLAGISYLQARGETERAVEELKKFRTIYPDYRPAKSGE